MQFLCAEKLLESIDPASGKVLAVLRPDSVTTVRSRVACARRASEKWRMTAPEQRLAIIRKLHSVVAVNAVSIAQTLSAETGRPLQESLGAEVLPTLSNLRYLMRRALDLLKPERIAAQRTSAYAEPYGVIGIIGTWNYPLFLNLIPICQGLVAGNTVVWKPSELAIFSAQMTQRLLESAGLPDGVLEVAYGDAATGRALTQAGCDKYVFTGGVQTGREIMAELAKSGKPCVMELSGNDAFIVCADAPMDAAARSAVWGRVSNGGQSCVAPQRFYVARSVYWQFLGRVLEQLEQLSDFELTPLRTAVARERCHRLVCEAVEEGAQLMHGGRFDADRPGFWYSPTLLADCTDTMAVMAEDLFGPIIAVCAVADEKEAIDRANVDPFGLAASVWTSDPARGALLASQLRVGLVSVNDVLLDAAQPAISFGGVKASGFGKQRGAEGLKEFFIRKIVALHPPNGARRHLFPYRPAAQNLLSAAAELQGPRGWKAIPDLIRAALDWQRQRKSADLTGETQP